MSDACDLGERCFKIVSPDGKCTCGFGKGQIMSEKKPRECFVSKAVFKAGGRHYAMTKPMVKSEWQRVIHGDDYDALKAENERLRKALVDMVEYLEDFCPATGKGWHVLAQAEEALASIMSQKQENSDTSQGYDQKSGKSKHEEQGK